MTEFLVGSSYCAACGKYHSAGGRVANSLYGPRLHAQVCYWKYSLGLTLLKIQKLLREQYGLELSTGQLSEIVTRTAKKFADGYEDLKTSLHDQSHLHVDETGWRLDGKNAWLKQKYLLEKLPARQIAVLIGCSHHAVNSALKRFRMKQGIAVRGRLGFEVRWGPHGRIVPARLKGLIRWMTKLRHNGSGYREIARRLEVKGVGAPSGQVKWYACTVRSILMRNR